MLSVKKVVLAVITMCTIVAVPFSQVFTNAPQPPAGRTGCTAGLDETTCGASNCHNNNPNTGAGSLLVSFSDPNLKYLPGQIYNMTVTTSESGMVKYGFEITSVTAAGDSVGTFIIPNGTTNISVPTSGAVNHREYLGHKTASSNSTWNFQWKAPAGDKGQLCFYVASNCANGNGTSSGDHIYTTSVCILPDSANGITASSAAGDAFSILSFVNNKINLQYSSLSGDPVLISLYGVRGELIQTLCNCAGSSGVQTRSFTLSHSLASGIYIVRYSTANMSEARKFFIQNNQ